MRMIASVSARRRQQRGLIALALVVTAFAIGAAGCDQRTAPAASRAPDVPYEPTPHPIVAEMLKLARVTADDLVYDLGCGDGRIVIAAAKLGARGVCVDIDPQRIRESRANAERAGVAGRIAFLNQDLFETDIAEASVVTLFLWPSVNLKLRPKLWRELKPGTRVLSYIHSMDDWRPQETVNVESPRGPRKLFLWIIPADRERALGIMGVNIPITTLAPRQAIELSK
jgi:SAM-dependent methyltransferase